MGRKKAEPSDAPLSAKFIVVVVSFECNVFMKEVLFPSVKDEEYKMYPEKIERGAQSIM